MEILEKIQLLELEKKTGSLTKKTSDSPLLYEELILLLDLLKESISSKPHTDLNNIENIGICINNLLILLDSSIYGFNHREINIIQDHIVSLIKFVESNYNNINLFNEYEPFPQKNSKSFFGKIDFLEAVAHKEAVNSKKVGQTVLQVIDNQLVSIAPNGEQAIIKTYRKPTRKPRKSLVIS